MACGKKIVVIDDVAYNKLVVKGATWYIRDVLKSLGFRYNPQTRSWFLDLDTHDLRPEELVETISKSGYKLSLLKSYTEYYERDAPSGAVYVFQIVC